MEQEGIFRRISDAVRASRSELGLLVLLGVAVVGSGLLVILRTPEAPPPRISRVMVQPSPTAAPKMLVVHVAGQVVTPGVYQLPEGSRVQDAVKAAGGPSQQGDINALNLAAPVLDGQKITVTRPGEAPPDPSVAAGSVGGSGGPAPDAAGMPGTKVNLNTATQAQLEELPSVGPVLAGRIMAYRQSKGRFTSARQLLEVSGFGPKKYEALKGLITV